MSTKLPKEAILNIIMKIHITYQSCEIHNACSNIENLDPIVNLIHQYNSN